MSSGATYQLAAVRLSGRSLYESFRLRFLVWNEECALLPEFKDAQLLRDEHDQHAVHFGIFDSDALVASSRCCIHARIEDLPDSKAFAKLSVPSPIATMNRLVVQREYRNRGCARTLHQARIGWAIEQGANSIICCAAAERSRSLMALGFEMTALRDKSYFQSSYEKSFIVHYWVVRANPAG